MELYVACTVSRDAAESREVRRNAVRNFGESPLFGLPWSSVIFPAKNEKDAKARAKSLLNRTNGSALVYVAALGKAFTVEKSLTVTDNS